MTATAVFAHASSRQTPAAGVTVAIPVYNEAAILAAHTLRVLDYLQRIAVPHQVIIGSNGSTDATIRIGRDLERTHSGVLEFFHLHERGVGLAFREFVRRARFPVLVSLDMDLSSDLAFVAEAVALADHHDIVIGSKKLAVQRRSLVRRMGSDAFLWCVRRFTGLPYDDYSIGAKAYRVEFLRALAGHIDNGSSYVLDLCHEARREGRPVARIPVSCEDRRASKFNLPREGVYKFARLFSLILRERRRARGRRARVDRVHEWQASDRRA